MLTIHVRNVNDALSLGVMYLRSNGVVRESRNGETIEINGPVATRYSAPNERVLFDDLRNANPFFHLMESLWILAGRDDVAAIKTYLPTIGDFSDNGITFHGAYGARLRHNGIDQIQTAIEMLKKDPTTRRVVLQLWDHMLDLNHPSKDIPCNDMIGLKVRDNELQMTVFCRSNDMVWGAYGTNVVQFSMLQEFIASAAGVKVGPYTQISDSFHVYTSLPYWQEVSRRKETDLLPDLYTQNVVKPYPLFHNANQAEFEDDLARLFNTGVHKGFRTLFFTDVVYYVGLAHASYRDGDLAEALYWTGHIRASDWRTACRQWLERLIQRRKAA